MRPALGPCWDVRIKDDRAYIYRRKDNQVVGNLTGAEALILGLMDGSRTLADLSSLVTTAVGESGAGLLNALASRLGPLLVDGCFRQSPYTPEALARVKTPDRQEGIRSLPGPRVLHWCVTSYCPRMCVYCYAEPRSGHEARDAVLTRDKLREIFKEASSLGAESLLVSGAEPLLREDLPEVMGDAVEQGIIPAITTKHPITGHLARRFADAGIRHICLSLDAMTAKENELLIGDSHYPARVRRSVQNLSRAGVGFSVETVVTRLNARSVPAVAEFAARAGARVLQVVPFAPVQLPARGVSNEAMALEHPEVLEEQVESLAKHLPSLRVELFEDIEKRTKSRYHCDVGKTKLFFLPDGVVHRCYKLTRDKRLQGADLRKVSVAAAWHDPTFQEVLSPPKERYVGSACWGCRRFDQCHEEGRCIYRALINEGEYTARDRSCSGPF